ncbi:MAG: MFS transporter [Micromonosporaceae bacterium]
MPTLAVTADATAQHVVRVQRRTLVVLVISQVLSGVGTAIGLSVGALLVARMAGGPGLSGLAQSAVTVGAAVFALPVARLMQARGRGPGLILAYALGTVGGLLVVGATSLGSVPLAIAGLFLFGGGIAAGLQARYAAVDLSPPERRGRHMSLVVWATTIGAVAGPNLAAPADQLVRPFGIAELAGPFLFSALAYAAILLLLVLGLRPDPLRLARKVATDAGVAAPAGSRALRAAYREIRQRPAAVFGLVAIAAGHAVMLAVMVMTPVHIDESLRHAQHDVSHGAVLVVVGVVISLHVAGMYAFSPLTGYAADRFGRRPVILVGAALLLAACALAGTANGDVPRLTVGLVLLGLGWSCTMVAGSTLLTESVPEPVRPSAQGLSDLVMGLGGATAGALAGVVVELAGYSALNVVAAVILVPLLVLAVRRPARVPA